MANLQAYFRSQAPNSLRHPAELLRTVNRHFYDSTAAERFATLFFAIYDDRTRQLRYVNCAHCAPLLLRATGEIENLPATATMVGAFANWTCTEAATELRVGDTLLLFSDGVTEAEADSGDDFGEERLCRALRVNQWQPAEELVQSIVDDVAQFSGGARSDDV